MNAVLLFLGGRFGVWALYAAAALAVLMATDLGRLHFWTVPRLEAKVDAAEGRAATAISAHKDAVIAAEKAAREQSERFRATEAAWAAKTQETEREAQTKIAAARADAAAAAGAAERLRRALASAAAAARRPAGASAPADGSPAPAEAAGVLADVCERADRRAGRLAEIADAWRIAHEACVGAFPMNPEVNP